MIVMKKNEVYYRMLKYNTEPYNLFYDKIVLSLVQGINDCAE